MRHLQAVVLVCLSGMIGCSMTGTLSSTPLPEVRATAELEAGPEVVFLDIALLERPTGDRFLNHDVWESGDEQGVALESKPILEENGLRVCQIGGLLPPRLQGLLGSRQSCPDPRRLRAIADQPTPVQIGPARARCAFRMEHPEGGRAIDVARATCFFEVVPLIEADGRVRLRFTPRIRHGDTRLETRVVREADGSLRWGVEPCDAVESLPGLGWEVTLTAEEYAVVGARLDRPDTLGTSYFVPDGPEGPTQRLLVVRATRQPWKKSETVTHELAAPLALQAGWTVRGSQR